WTTLREWVKADGAAPPEWDNPALDESRARQARAESLFEVLDAWAARYAVDELYERAQLLRLPYAAVRPPEVLLRDPHLAARGFFAPTEHPARPAALPYPGAPCRAGGLPWHVARPPRLGEHEAAVDAEWGASAAP